MAEEKKYVATSTNLNNPLVFNNTVFVQKPPPATDLPLSQSGPAGVAALKFIVEPLLRPPDGGIFCGAAVASRPRRGRGFQVATVASRPGRPRKGG